MTSAGLTLKLQHCFFTTDVVDYLGHTLRPGKLEGARITTGALRCFRLRTNISVLRLFFGFCDVYLRFVPTFSRTAARLNAKLKKGESMSFTLHKSELVGMEQLKDKLTTPPILAFPIGEGKLANHTDAWDKKWDV